MKKLSMLTGVLILTGAFFSAQSHAGKRSKMTVDLTNQTLERTCQSQGEHEGRMVYLDFYRVNSEDNSYTAVMQEAKTTSSRRTVFNVVENIQQDRRSAFSRHMYSDNKSFNLTRDIEYPDYNYELTWVTYPYEGEKLSLSMTCRTISE